MRYIMVAALLMTCAAPQPLLKSGDPTSRKVLNKISIKGDSNVVNLNYYHIINADTVRLKTDTIP